MRGARVLALAALAVVVGLAAGVALVLAFPGPPADDKAPATRPSNLAPPAKAALAASTPCERLAISMARRDAFWRGTGPRTLVMGDSWSTGGKLRPGRPTWTTHLHATVSVNGVPGSGFARDALPCPGLSFGDRAAGAIAKAGPVTRVVVQGGINDSDQVPDAIRAGFERMHSALGDRDVVVIGPPLAPGRLDGARMVAGLLEGLTRDAGYTYLDMTDLDLEYLGDGVHLTVEGHRQFGQAVAERLAALD